MEYKKSIYVLPAYKVYFDDQLANNYKPIVYSHECLSGDPEGLYYRIVKRVDREELCIQYFFYWLYQKCMVAHRYDYEPILIYLKKDSSYLIVNGGLGSMECKFHKNEVRPLEGIRSNDTVPFSVKLSPKPYYPFGNNGNVECTGCVKEYPLSGDDLQFEQTHALFGIRACSNVFSGAGYDLEGHRFDPPLKRLTDKVLSGWYFKHYNHFDDMPFGHDVSDPFSYPYIKYTPVQEQLDKFHGKK
jgi:hypothetical protein